MIADGYALTIRPQCASASACEGSVALTRPIVFSVPTINITTASYYRDTPIVAAVCPLFTFVGAVSVSISNMVIACGSTNDEAKAPAILFENSASLHLELDTILATGWVLSTVLVMGGNFEVIPPTRATDLSGVASAVNVADSVYSDAVAITLSDYTGTLNVENMSRYARLVIAPDVGGNLTTANNTFLDITDASLLTAIYGRTVETELNADGDLYGYSRDTVNNLGKQMLMWAVISFVVLVVLAIVMYQNISSRYNTLEQLDKIEG